MKTILIRTFLFLLIFGLSMPARAAFPASNEVAVDIPFEGGAMLMFARDWRIARYLRLGVIAGGGQIQRTPNVRMPDGQDVEVDVETTIFPFVGPRISFATPAVGISLGFAVFHAKSETDLHWPGQGQYAGSVTDWGTGFHAPFLELEFAHSKKDLVFGVGLGGFFSTSFSDLKASGPSGDLAIDTSPINTLTGRVKIVWGFGRVRAPRYEDNDF